MARWICNCTFISEKFLSTKYGVNTTDRILKKKKKLTKYWILMKKIKIVQIPLSKWSL